jgi:hypothetical protein
MSFIHLFSFGVFFVFSVASLWMLYDYPFVYGYFVCSFSWLLVYLNYWFITLKSILYTLLLSKSNGSWHHSCDAFSFLKKMRKRSFNWWVIFLLFSFNIERKEVYKWRKVNKKTTTVFFSRDSLTMGYFDNLDNEPLNKY